MSMRKDKEKVLEKIDEALCIANRMVGRAQGIKWTNKTLDKADDLANLLQDAYDAGEEVPDTKKDQ